MIKIRRLLGLTVFCGLFAGAAHAQVGWDTICVDPDALEDGSWLSDDYNTVTVQNNLFRASMGTSGTATLGACYDPARTIDMAGRFGFMVGSVGSVQTDFDNLLALTFGAPFYFGQDYCYFRITKGDDTPGNSVLFGDGGMRSFYVGASKRYMVGAWSDADVDAEVETRILGDTARLRWRLRNLGAEAQPLGLYFAAWPAMQTSNFRTDDLGSTASNSYVFGYSPRMFSRAFQQDRYVGWTIAGAEKPLRTERLWKSTSLTFPEKVEFLFSQNQPYGLRLDNVPDKDTADAATADLFVVGNMGHSIGPGLIWDMNLRPTVFGDPTGEQEEADILLREAAFIQRFPVRPVATGAFRDIIHYIRGPWSVGDYNDPYAFLVDAPQIVGPDPDVTGNPLTPNPMTIVAYVDNQYARIDREVTLNNVRFTISLPSGFSLASGETATKVLGQILPNAVASVQWRVTVDAPIIGKFPFNVTVSPTPGPSKQLTGEIQVGAQPKLRLGEGPNMVSVPYNFADSSLDKILGLQAGVDYTAFKWDPTLLSYKPATSVERGGGIWLLPNSDLGYKTLQNAKLPSDSSTGGVIYSLQQGWNLIGNPYNYPVPIQQLVAVAEDAPEEPLSWAEAVQQGFVSSSFVYYDRDPAVPNSGTYKYTLSLQEELQPHRGYWIYVGAFRPLRMVWPPVFVNGLPGATRSPESSWAQTEKQWRLQLSARSQSGYDAYNFVGMAKDPKTLDALRLPKPPMAPNAKIELSVEGEYMDKTVPMALAVDGRSGRKEWKLRVRAEEPGDVTITWPNLPSVPRNVRAKLIDDVTKVTKDLRAVSGYTFHMSEAGTRELTLITEPGGSSRAVIGNVLVSRPSRDPNSPITLTYALSADALISVRILSGTGKEIYTVTRGRAESAGENTATWFLRDNANRAVAPGVYRAEILAETPTGERVRKIVPINVVR